MIRQLLVFAFLVSAWLAYGQRSVFNGEVFKVDTTGNYRIVVGGHFYGNSTNSGYPASTLLGGLGRIMDFHPNALFVTGDLFLDLKRDTANYRRSLFDKLNTPIFNAVGNHDLDGDHYAPFTPTYFHFFLANDLFIVLDTEMDNSDIVGKQLKMLKDALAKATALDCGNVFIFSHRPVWAIGHPRLDKLLSDNTRSLTGNNYRDQVHQLLKDHSAKVRWFSGSMGGQGAASFLYHKEDGIEFILTAIRDTRRDAVLGVHVDNGEVAFETIPLGAQETMRLEDYDLDYWDKGPKDEGFNFRLLPYLIKTTVTHKVFWWGIGVALAFMLIGKWLLASRK